MDRSQALSPLKTGEGRFTMTAGLAIRGQIRQVAVQLGVDYYEERGWFESTLVLRGPADRVIRLKTMLEQHFGED